MHVLQDVSVIGYPCLCACIESHFVPVFLYTAFSPRGESLRRVKGRRSVPECARPVNGGARSPLRSRSNCGPRLASTSVSVPPLQSMGYWCDPSSWARAQPRAAGHWGRPRWRDPRRSSEQPSSWSLPGGMVDACAMAWSPAVADVADVAGVAAEGGSAQWGSGCLQRSAPGEKDGSVAVGRADVTGHW